MKEIIRKARNNIESPTGYVIATILKCICTKFNNMAEGNVTMDSKI